jgi:excisionase family DNA binding protein
MFDLNEKANWKTELFSTKEAARRLDIKPETLRRFARERKIGWFLVGKERKFNQYILEAYMETVFEPPQ